MKLRVSYLSILLLALIAEAAATDFSAGPAMFQPGQDWPGAAQSGAYVGINIRNITPDRVPLLKLKNTSGAEVTMVDQDAPAGKAGLREHDVIVSFNGTPVENEGRLRELVHHTPPGATVTMGIVRHGQPMNVQLTVADRVQFATMVVMPPSMPSMPAPPFFPMPDFEMPPVNAMHVGPSGAVLENLTPQLCEYFGLKNGRSGVLVRSVEKGSPAAAAGLKAGDVIVRVEKEPITDINDWWRTMHGRSGPTAFTVIRNRREVNLSIRVGRNRRSAICWPPELQVQFDLNF